MSRKIGALVEYALPCQSGDQIDELSEKMRKTISVHCPFILLYWRPQASNNYRNIFDSLVLQIPRSFLHISEALKWILSFFLLVSNLFSPRVSGSALRPRFLFYVQYWQDAGIRTRVTATTARCATNELHSTHMAWPRVCLTCTILDLSPLLPSAAVPSTDSKRCEYVSSR